MTNTALATMDEQLPVAQSNATSLLQAITQAASNPATDIEKMERLFALHERLVKSDAETAYNAAMARAQEQMEPVIKNRRNDQTNSNYANLAAINEAIKPIYTKEGFSITFDTADSPKPDYLRVLAFIQHKQGHTKQLHIDMPPDDSGIKGTVNKTKVHATGSTSSYARRYLVCMAFNIDTVDDTDGNRKRESLRAHAGIEKSMTIEQKIKIDGIFTSMREWINQGSIVDAWTVMDNAALDTEEKIYLWTLFDSGERRQLKDEGERQRIKRTTKPINDAQKKRLEAMIAERKLDRDEVKAQCLKDYGKAHFAELNSSEYDSLCSQIETVNAEPPQSASHSPVDAGSAPADGSAPSTEAEGTLGSVNQVGSTPTPASTLHAQINDALANVGTSLSNRFSARLKAGVWGAKTVDELTPQKANDALAWINTEADK